MKKKFLAAAMILSLAASMAACGTSSGTSSEATTQAVQAAEATTEEKSQPGTEIQVSGITFTIPEIFGTEDTEDVSEDQKMFYGADGDTVGLLLFSTQDANGVTADDMVSMQDTMVSNIVGSYDDSQLIDSSTGEIAGIQAIQCSYTANVEGTTCVFDTYMTVANDKIILIQLNETAENENFEQAFADMITSAK